MNFKPPSRDDILRSDWSSAMPASGQGFDYHLARKAELIGRPWDLVVMQSHSLLNLAKQIMPLPPERELDMLLATGEHQSATLLSMALHSLGIPAIAGAGALELKRLSESSLDLAASAPLLAIGVAGAFLSGLVAIQLLFRILDGGSTRIFVAYRLVFAAILVASFVVRGGL